MFLFVANKDATLVSYRGAGPALTDLMAGTVDVVIDQTVTMIPLHTSNRVKSIGVASKERLKQIPDVPTFIEGGVAAFDLSVWNGMSAPAGTPPAIIDRLAQSLAGALKDPAVIERMDQMAAVIPPLSQQGPKAFGELIAKDTARFTELIRAAKISAEN